MRRVSFAICLASFAFTLAACSGHGDGTSGDPEATPLANDLGPGARIHQLIGPATWENPKDSGSTMCATPPTSDVYITGATVVGIDNFDETNNGALGNYYIQDTDPTLPLYSGATVFGVSFSPPALRLAEGDVVDLLGTYDEFIGPSSSHFSNCETLPELSGTLSFRFDAPSPSLPPKVVDPKTLTSYDAIRPYLGMLIELDDVTLNSSGSGSSGRYSAGILESNGNIAIANELYDVKSDPGLTSGQKFKKVVGVVTYFYDFHICPRSRADLVE